MYDIFETAISQGRFDLTDLSCKISRYHIEGLLTDSQRDDLVAQAQAKADPHAAYGTWQREIDAIWEAIRDLQDAPVTEGWPDWVQPTGAHDAYQTGARVTFEGKRYTSKRDGNVWSPAVLPSAWEAV